MLLYVCCTWQSGVGGLVEGFDIVLTLNFHNTLSHDVFEWSQEASPTAVDSARCTEVARSYGSLAGNRRLDVYRVGPCLAKLDRVMSARYRPPARLYSATALTFVMIRSTMPGGTTQQRLLLKMTSWYPVG